MQMSRWSGIQIFLLLGCGGFAACKQMFTSDVSLETLNSTLARGNEPFVRPFVSLDVDSERRSWSCSGVLLGPRHVLTAARCVDSAKRISIRRFDQRMKAVQV